MCYCCKEVCNFQAEKCAVFKRKKQIQKHEEIFYCLPTFLNRDYRHQALHHCLFWRPEKGVMNRTAW